MRDKLFTLLFIILAILNTIGYYVEKTFLTVQKFYNQLIIKHQLKQKK